MKKSHLTLRQLEIFLAVVELGSFRRAGESLNLAPVVVGEHIRTLEGRLNGALFERRSGSRPALTELGMRVLQRAREVMSAVGRLEKEAASKPDRSQWKFAFLPFMARHLAGRIVELRQRFPDAQIITFLRDEGIDELVRKVSSGEATLAMTITGENVPQNIPPDVEVRVLIDEPVALFVSCDHPLAKRRKLTVDDLRAFPMAMLPKAHPLRLVVDSVLEMSGMVDLSCSLETDDYSQILTAISHGHSIGCLFAEVTSSDAVAHRLQILDLAFHLPTPQAIMLCPRNADADRRLAAAADFLANHYRFDAAVARTRQEGRSV